MTTLLKVLLVLDVLSGATTFAGWFAAAWTTNEQDAGRYVATGFVALLLTGVLSGLATAAFMLSTTESKR